MCSLVHTGEAPRFLDAADLLYAWANFLPKVCVTKCVEQRSRVRSDVMDGRPLQRWIAEALCSTAACAAAALQQLDRQSVAIGFSPYYLPDRPLKVGRNPTGCSRHLLPWQ